MDRRSFLKVLAGAGLVAAIPVAAIPESVLEPAPEYPLLSGKLGRYEGVRIYERSTQEFNYGDKIGICATSYVDGRRYRHAAMLPTQFWRDIDDAEREECWRLVERKCGELAVRA